MQVSEGAGGAQTVTYNFEKLLSGLAALSGWKAVSGPETGVGAEYFFECEDDEGETHSAWVSIDQVWITVEVDGETVMDAPLSEDNDDDEAEEGP